MKDKTKKRDIPRTWVKFEIFLFLLFAVLAFVISSVLITFMGNILHETTIKTLSELSVLDYFTLPFKAEKQGVLLMISIGLVILYIVQFFWFGFEKIFKTDEGFVRSNKKEHGSQRVSTLSELKKDIDTMQVLVGEDGHIIEAKLPENFTYKGWVASKKIDSLTVPKEKLKTLEGLGGMMFAVMKDSNFSDVETNYLDVSASNKLILGVSRAGKGRRNIKPNIVLNMELGSNLFIHDPKGELYEATYQTAKDNGYDVIYYNFKEMDIYIDENGEKQIISGLGRSACFNPMAYIYKLRWDYNLESASSSMLEKLAHVLFYNKEQKDPYWMNTSKAVFKTMAWILLEMKDEELFNIPNVYNMINEFTVLYSDPKSDNYLLKFIRGVAPGNPIAGFFTPVLSATGAVETMSSILSSTATSLQKWVSSPDIKRVLSKSDIDFDALAKKKVVVYAITPDGRSVGDSIIAVMIDQIYEALTTNGDINIDNGKQLDRQFNFLLDEFGNFPPINDLESKVTQCLSRNIRFWLYLQSPQQLNEVYGDKKTDIIMDNCQTLQYLKATNEKTNKMMSERLGNFTIEKETLNDKGKASSTSTTHRALFTVQELAQLEHIKSIVIRMTTLKVRYPEVFSLPDYAETNIRKLLDNGFLSPLPAKIKDSQAGVPLDSLKNKRKLTPEEVFEEIRKKKNIIETEETEEIEETEKEEVEPEPTEVIYTSDDMVPDYEKKLESMRHREMRDRGLNKNRHYDSTTQDTYFAMRYSVEKEIDSDTETCESYKNCVIGVEKRLLDADKGGE